jgi:hypothetical protein
MKGFTVDDHRLKNRRSKNSVSGITSMKVRFNERDVLPDKGAKSADSYVETKYEECATKRRGMLEADAERHLSQNLEKNTRKLPNRATPKRH